MRRPTIIAIAAASAALSLTCTPAIAATTHYDYPRTCYDIGGGSTACYSSTSHYNATQTPSGNYTYAGQGHSTYSILDPAGIETYSTSYDYKYNFLIKDGVGQTSRILYTATFTQNGQTCEAYDHYMFANGEVRHDQFEVVCV